MKTYLRKLLDAYLTLLDPEFLGGLAAIVTLVLIGAGIIYALHKILS